MMNSNELWISQQAHALGNQLIKEMNITRGCGMADFLGVNHCYDNHQAVFVWIDRILEQQPEINEISVIQKQFLNSFPDCVYQLA